MLRQVDEMREIGDQETRLVFIQPYARATVQGRTEMGRGWAKRGPSFTY